MNVQGLEAQKSRYAGIELYVSEDILQGEDVPFFITWKRPDITLVELRLEGFTDVRRVFNVKAPKEFLKTRRFPTNALIAKGYLGGVLDTPISDKTHQNAVLKVHFTLTDGDIVLEERRVIHSARIKAISVPRTIVVEDGKPEHKIELEVSGAATLVISLRQSKRSRVKIGLPATVFSAMEAVGKAFLEGIELLSEHFPKHRDVLERLNKLMEEPGRLSPRELVEKVHSILEPALSDSSFTEGIAAVLAGAFLAQASIRDSLVVPLKEYFEATAATRVLLASPLECAMVPAGGGVLECELLAQDLRANLCGDPVKIRLEIVAKKLDQVPIKDLLLIRRVLLG